MCLDKHSLGKRDVRAYVECACAGHLETWAHVSAAITIVR